MSSDAPYVYSVVPLFNTLIDHVEDFLERNGLSPVVKSAIKACREKLVEYYSKTNATTMLCTALDPRRKLRYFEQKGFILEEINDVKDLYVFLHFMWHFTPSLHSQILILVLGLPNYSAMNTLPTRNPSLKPLGRRRLVGPPFWIICGVRRTSTLQTRWRITSTARFLTGPLMF